MATREQNLRHRYGIGVEDYEEMYKKQNECCAICGIKKKTYLDVDHCHTTGKVRGLLCRNCNTGIGKFYEDVKLLTNAISYLTTQGCFDLPCSSE